MFRELLEQRSILADAAVNITAQINRTVDCIGTENPIIPASIKAATQYAENEGYLKKSELLSIWCDEQISFAAKCLITIWWGKPSHLISTSVYTEHNLAILSNPEVEQDFITLADEVNFARFLDGMRDLFRKFERGGEYHLNGINTAFFTKIFHFYFASHPIASNPDFLPVIADKWMKLAVYAEMSDKGDDARHTIFSLRNNDPQNIDFACHNGSAASSYLDFISYFNEAVHDMKADFSSLTPFVLEDVVFNDSKEITPLFVHKDYNSLLLPPWIAGRYNAPAQTAILFNNILGESYLFEEGSAQIIGELLKTDYWKPIDVDSILALLECTECELLAFFVELKKQSVIADHILDDAEIKTLRKLSARNKKRMLKRSRGTENLQSVFELADTDYRDKIENQQIPTSVSIELTYGCNEMCIHCYNPGSSRLECITKKVASDELVYSDYCSLLDQLAEMGVPKLLFTGGDPFVKKDFIKILQYAHRKKFAISIYTNGQSLYNNEQYYKDIIDCYPYSVGLSLYSVNPEIHERITRVKGSCEKTKVIANRLSGDGMNMLIKCPIMKYNKDCYRDVYKFALSI